MAMLFISNHLCHSNVTRNLSLTYNYKLFIMFAYDLLNLIRVYDKKCISFKVIYKLVLVSSFCKKS